MAARRWCLARCFEKTALPRPQKISGCRLAELGSTQAIVGSWPYEFDTAKAARMGFPAADSIDGTIRAHVEDELGGIVGGKA